MTRHFVMALSAAAIIAGTFTIDASLNHAEAAKRWECIYMAQDSSGKLEVGTAKHRKAHKACNKARKRCERTVKKERAKGNFGRNALPGPACLRKFVLERDS